MDSDQELRAARLRQARKAAGFEDAAQAANRFGWNVISYRSHENGLRGVKPTVGKNYAKAFKVSAAWLMTGEGAMKSYGIDQQIMALPPALSEEALRDIEKILAAAHVRAKIALKP